MPEPPACPIHKSNLRQLSSPLQTKEESLGEGSSVVVLECDAPDCPVKYSVTFGGFFKLDENGKPIPLR